MTPRPRLRSLLARVTQQEQVNFLLTNRIPRRLATQLLGWFSKIEQPLVRDLSIRVWRLFSDLDLSEAKTSHFKSMHDCFTRELREGARPIDGDIEVLVSPCDAIVGACGPVAGTEVLQVKGFPYALSELFGGPELDEVFRDGHYATLRLTSSMYHRFHAPYDCRVEQVTYISGDTWNVNPIALKRVEKLFCKNERALIRTRLSATGHPIMLVPVAAILVASIRLHFLDVLLNLKHKGPNIIACDAAFKKGEELGWFEHGSTIIVFAPAGFTLCPGIEEGARVHMGQALMRLP
ncbi:MAG: phosphatidylserine decarboxylase [Hyphomicrobiaceae bacterium]|nr:phosphatidylserine decarboxylase [Hyphomicrobiaceae bacterium]